MSPSPAVWTGLRGARKPRLLAVCLAVALLLSAAATAPDARSAPRACSAGLGGTVLARHAMARVYLLRSHPVRGSVAERAWYGCLRGQRGHRLLAVDYGDVEEKAELSLTMPRVRGVWAAWVEDSAVFLPGRDPPCERRLTITRANLRTGRRAALALPGYQPGNNAPCSGAMVVTDLALSPHGKLGWIQNNHTPQVFAFDPSAPRLLDPGPGIDPSSLRVEITIASWTRDGLERFARLP
jgi:hypothetical protein